MKEITGDTLSRRFKQVIFLFEILQTVLWLICSNIISKYNFFMPQNLLQKFEVFCVFPLFFLINTHTRWSVSLWELMSFSPGWETVQYFHSLFFYQLFYSVCTDVKGVNSQLKHTYKDLVVLMYVKERKEISCNILIEWERRLEILSKKWNEMWGT